MSQIEVGKPQEYFAYFKVFKPKSCGKDPQGAAADLFRGFLKKPRHTLRNDTSKRGDLNAFPDGSKTASWVKEAMQWTVAEKIIGGSDGKLLPQGSATRAQVATILMRFIENIANK